MLVSHILVPTGTARVLVNSRNPPLVTMGGAATKANFRTRKLFSTLDKTCISASQPEDFVHSGQPSSLALSSPNPTATEISTSIQLFSSRCEESSGNSRQSPVQKLLLLPEVEESSESCGSVEGKDEYQNVAQSESNAKSEAGLIPVGGTLPNHPGFYAESLQSKSWQYWIYDQLRGWVLVADEIAPFELKHKRRAVRRVGAWEEFFDASSNAYYFVNVGTGEATWDAPICFQNGRVGSCRREETSDDAEDLEAMIDSWQGLGTNTAAVESLSAKLVKLFDDHTQQVTQHMVAALDSRLEGKKQDFATMKAELREVRQQVKNDKITHNELLKIDHRLTEVEAANTLKQAPEQPNDTDQQSTRPLSLNKAESLHTRGKVLPKLQVPPRLPVQSRK